MQNDERCLNAPRHGTDADTGRRFVENLTNGAVPLDGLDVAERYRITKGASRDAHHGFRANDLMTNQRVFLKFCPGPSQRFKSVIKMYDMTEQPKHVCKLIDMLPGTDGLPPCFVFEAGSFTLAQRLAGRAMAPVEKLSIVQSILRAIHGLHQRKIVHGNLDPAYIVRSSAEFCWKFTGLDFASRFGEPIPLHRRSVTRYTAPEIQQAIEQNSMSARSDGSADMWALGLIAFEIFTGKPILDADSAKRYIAEEQDRLAKQFERDTAPGAGIFRKLFTSVPQCLREFEFVLRLLAERRDDRPSATQALESDVFGVAIKPRDPMQELEDCFCGRGALSSRIISMKKWLVCYAAFRNHLDVSVCVERFAQRGHPEVAFHQREAIKTKEFTDNDLPGQPVYVLPIGEHFRLYVSLTRDSRIRFPFGKVVFVKLQTPEGEVQPLELWQRNGGDRLDVTALVVPSEFKSQRLNTKSPFLGLAEKKYVRLTVHIRFRLGDGFPHDFDVYWPIYCRLGRRSMRFSCLRAMHQGMRAASIAFLR